MDEGARFALYLRLQNRLKDMFSAQQSFFYGTGPKQEAGEISL